MSVRALFHSYPAHLTPALVDSSSSGLAKLRICRELGSSDHAEVAIEPLTCSAASQELLTRTRPLTVFPHPDLETRNTVFPHSAQIRKHETLCFHCVSMLAEKKHSWWASEHV